MCMCLLCMCAYNQVGHVTVVEFPYLGQEVRIYSHTYMCLTKIKSIQGHSQFQDVYTNKIHSA